MARHKPPQTALRRRSVPRRGGWSVDDFAEGSNRRKHSSPAHGGMRSVSDLNPGGDRDWPKKQRKPHQEHRWPHLSRLPQANDLQAQRGVGGERSEPSPDDRGGEDGVYPPAAGFEPRGEIDVEQTREPRVEPGEDDPQHERTEQVHDQEVDRQCTAQMRGRLLNAPASHGAEPAPDGHERQDLHDRQLPDELIIALRLGSDSRTVLGLVDRRLRHPPPPIHKPSDNARIAAMGVPKSDSMALAE
jgi:hypothetical protein